MKRIQLAAAIAVMAMATTSVAQLCLSTTFASNNGQSGNMFDIVATTSVVIQTFDVNLDPGTHDLEVYIVTGGGTHVGQETNAAAWTMVGSVTGISSLGTDIPTPLNLTIAVPIPPGQTPGLLRHGLERHGHELYERELGRRRGSCRCEHPDPRGIWQGVPIRRDIPAARLERQGLLHAGYELERRPRPHVDRLAGLRRELHGRLLAGTGVGHGVQPRLEYDRSRHYDPHVLYSR